MKQNEIDLIRHGKYTIVKLYSDRGDEISISQDETGRQFLAVFLNGGNKADSIIEAPNMQNLVDVMRQYGFIQEWEGDEHV